MTRVFTIGYPFCGAGLGASGSDASVASYKGESATFRNVGGIDFDPVACRNFEMLTGAKALCADVKKLTPAELRSFWGEKCPDAIEGSAPCKKASGLLPLKQAQHPKYEEMNELMVIFSELIFRTYGPDGGPLIAIWENVPNLLSRAKPAVDAMVRTWAKRGYAVSYAKHNLGEEGGLAQNRERLAIVFRHQKRCPSPMLLPPKKQLKTVGSVLESLPWPDDPTMAIEREGKLVTMHHLPRLSWVNMVRLALIGIDWGKVKGEPLRKPRWDWRDLPPRGDVESWLSRRGLWPVSVTVEARERLEQALLGAPSQKRNEVFRREPVQPWGQPSPTVTGPGGAGLSGVQDPRPVENLAMPTDNEGRHATKYAAWPDTEPGRTVTGSLQVGSGGPSVADSRVRELEAISEKREGRPGFMQVGQWNQPSNTVTSRTEATAGQSMGAVQDPRPAERLALTHTRATRFSDQYRVQGWEGPAATVTGTTDVQEGAPLVADPRVLENLSEGLTGDNAASFKGRPGYRQVGQWSQPTTPIIANASSTGGGGYAAVADVRALDVLGLNCRCYNGFYGVLPWARPSTTVIASLQVDCGTAAVADPRPVPLPRAVISLGMAIQLLAEGWEVPKGALAPAIIAPDGTWHRPLTTLELAVIQSLPAVLDGSPLVFHGGSDKLRREHIGNGIPRDAAMAWGRQVLDTLLRSAMGEGFILSSGNIWVRPEEFEQLLPT